MARIPILDILSKQQDRDTDASQHLTKPAPSLRIIYSSKPWLKEIPEWMQTLNVLAQSPTALTRSAGK